MWMKWNPINKVKGWFVSESDEMERQAREIMELIEWNEINGMVSLGVSEMESISRGPKLLKGSAVSSSFMNLLIAAGQLKPAIN